PADDRADPGTRGALAAAARTFARPAVTDTSERLVGEAGQARRSSRLPSLAAAAAGGLPAAAFSAPLRRVAVASVPPARDPRCGGICNCIQFSVIIGRWTR